MYRLIKHKFIEIQIFENILKLLANNKIFKVNTVQKQRQYVLAKLKIEYL